MKVNTISVFIGKHNRNEPPKMLEVENTNPDGVMFRISTGSKYSGIDFYLQDEKELINFKNSVCAAVDNYKRGK